MTSSLKSQPASLAKRLLFPTHPSNDLPLLLKSPTAPPELTAELYDFIAIALRAFVNPWWTKISRYDKDFLPEITRIVSQVVRNIEQRALAVDLDTLVFQDLPALVSQHYRDYRNASSKLSSSYATGGALSISQLFHQLQPHAALSSDGSVDKDYFRQVVDHLLKTCLPKEDYAPEAERLIVREVIVKVVLGDILPRITQPWFINKILLDILEPRPKGILQPTLPQPTTSYHFSYHTLLVIVLSAIQSVSGACLAFINAYKQAVSTIKLVNQSASRPSPAIQEFHAVRSHPTEASAQPIAAASSEDPVSVSTSPPPSIESSNSQTAEVPPPSKGFSVDTLVYNEDYATRPILLVSDVFAAHERFASNTILTVVLMFSSCFVVFFDRLLPYMLRNILTPDLVLNIVRAGKKTLFPNGYPGPPPIDPTPQQQAEMRAAILAWRGSGVTGHLLPILLGPNPERTIKLALDPLSDRACNVHLVMVILDRVLLALFPELATGQTH